MPVDYHAPHQRDNGLHFWMVSEPPQLSVFFYKSCFGQSWTLRYALTCLFSFPVNKSSVIATFSSISSIKRQCVWNAAGWADTSPLWAPLCTGRLSSKWALSPFAATLLKSCNWVCRRDWRDLTFRDLGSRQHIFVRNMSCKAAQPSPTALEELSLPTRDILPSDDCQ